MIKSPTPDGTKADHVEFLKKVWTDEAFGARLDSDPRAALAEIGRSLPDDVEIKVLRDTDTVKHLRIPTAVPEAELSDEELAHACRGQFTDDVDFKVVRDSDTVKYLHIPLAPHEGEISDADLLGARGGWTSLLIHTFAYSAGVTIASLITPSDPIAEFPPGTFD